MHNTHTKIMNASDLTELLILPPEIASDYCRGKEESNNHSKDYPDCNSRLTLLRLSDDFGECRFQLLEFSVDLVLKLGCEVGAANLIQAGRGRLRSHSVLQVDINQAKVVVGTYIGRRSN